MSLKIKNDITSKQKSFLKELGYIGDVALTMQEATDLIEELIEEKRLENRSPDPDDLYKNGTFAQWYNNKDME